MKWTLFLDRDGVLNQDLGYVHHFKDFKYLPGCIDGLRKLSNLNIDIFIITNQSGIARGLFTESAFIRLMKKVESDLLNKNIVIKKTFYCPHYSKGVIKKYAVECSCRKPMPGLINKAVDEFNIDVKKSIFIGDKITDMLAADAAGIKHRILLNNQFISNKQNFTIYDKWHKIVEYIKKNIIKT